MPTLTDPDLAEAVGSVLRTGVGLAERDVLAVLRLPDEELPAVLAAAHQVRMRWCGPEVEVEGIISLKTGGCPEDCHFCAQSGLFASPVRSAWLDVPSLVEAAKQTAKTGATEFCIVAAVRGPDERLMAQVAAGIEAIRREARRVDDSVTWRIDDLRIPVAGPWRVRVEILINDFEKVTLEDVATLPRLP